MLESLHLFSSLNYYFLVKNDANNTNTTKPTNPPLPRELIRAVRLPTTSMLKIAPPVNTNQRIDTGITAIKIDPNPPKNPVMYLITESMLISFFISLYLFSSGNSRDDFFILDTHFWKSC